MHARAKPLPTGGVRASIQMSFRGRKVRDLLQHWKTNQVASHICPDYSLKEHRRRIDLHVIQKDRGDVEKRKL